MPGPHLLYVAWGFPPARTGGVHRALATANAFARGGWQVSVITAPREVFLDVTGADPALEELVDDGVEVLRVPFDWPAQQTDLRQYSAMRVLTPRLWAKSRTWRDRRAFPEAGYGPWRRRIEAAALDLHGRRPVSLTLATTNPQVSVTPGLRLLADHGVPHVVDFRDAWTFHTYSGTRRLAADSPAGRWEARAVASAAEVWFVNEPLRRWHAGAYPAAAGRMHVVMNGYDHDLPAPTPFAARPPGTPLRFGYLGTLTPVVPLAEFVAGWRAAVSSGLRGAGPVGVGLPTAGPGAELVDAEAVLRGYLGYYATPDAALAAIVDGAADSRLSYAGPVSKTEVAQVYSGFDVLVLLLGGGEYVTSGKVFEYMSTGLPVVSVLTPGNAAAEVLRGYPRWHPAADLSPAAIAAALASAAADACADGPGQAEAHSDGPGQADASSRAQAAQAFARQFHRDAQLAPRVEALRALVTAAGEQP